MSTAVETLSKLERRITLTLPRDEIKAEVEKRLKDRARTAKAPGFRPGKVPLNMVAAQYGPQIEMDVINDQIGRAFSEATVKNELRVAGFPKIEPKEGEELAFDATFEVYPEVKIGDLASAEVEKTLAVVTDAEVDKTIDILRKQRSHFHVKGEDSAHGNGGSAVAENGDRVTVDFLGKIDGVEFAGGKAEDYTFELGQGRMLPEFETATLGLKVGESKEFTLSFPEDYHGKEVAGKTATFTVTLKKLEWAHLPEVNADFAKSLGIPDGDVAKMRADIKKNLEREVNARAKSKTKDSTMDALLKVSDLEVPQVLIEQDVERLMEMARQDMKQRGMDIKAMPLPKELFTQQAERRVRLGLILADLVKENKLEATEDQVKAQVNEFAESYEDPQEVVKYYFGDRRRLAEVESFVLEDNVMKYVLDNAKVTEKSVSFDELMGTGAQA